MFEDASMIIPKNLKVTKRLLVGCLSLPRGVHL
jgi:hypothetical protein